MTTPEGPQDRPAVDPPSGPPTGPPERGKGGGSSGAAAGAFFPIGLTFLILGISQGLSAGQGLTFFIVGITFLAIALGSYGQSRKDRPADGPVQPPAPGGPANGGPANGGRGRAARARAADAGLTAPEPVPDALRRRGASTRSPGPAGRW